MTYTGAYMVRYDVMTDEYVYSDGARYRASDLQMTHPALNPYQGLGGLHGGYRHANQTTHYHSPLGAYQGNAGIQAQAAANYQSQLIAQQAALGSLQNAYAQQRAGLAQALYADPKIEHAGIKAGEIIAWRCWSIDMSREILRSVFTGSPWEHDKPMTGDVRTNGVHAWKDKEVAIDYIQNMPPYVVGQVKLWGEVVEHEKGYRAENAKIVSLDMVKLTYGGLFWKRKANEILKNLRTNYGVN